MSSVPSPTAKAADYACALCGAGWMMPVKALSWDEIDGVPIENWRVKHEAPTRCHTCALLSGVNDQLRDLVFREPWLVTEGKAGEPEKQAWELVGCDDKVVSVVAGSANSSPGCGRTFEEAMEFREEVLASFMKTAGEGWIEADEGEDTEVEEASGGNSEGEEKKQEQAGNAK